MCSELYGDWSLHNHFSGINDFLSLTAKLLKTLSVGTDDGFQLGDDT